MVQHPQYYIVESSSLPEIFLKVAEANRLLATNEAATIGEACSKTGISRSAYYKYKDTILPFQNLLAGRVISFQILLKDVSGSLSGVLSVMANNGANLLGINSNVPSNGIATLYITAETANLNCPLEALLMELNRTPGVLQADIRAG